MTNTLVDFQIAILLKQKGFPQLMQGLYYTKDENHCLVGWGFNDSTENSFAQYSAPTITQVLEWLYQNHSIWIQVSFSHNDTKPFSWSINKTLRNLPVDYEDQNCWLSGIDCENIDGFDTPDQAFSAAISYVLENLIP